MLINSDWRNIEMRLLYADGFTVCIVNIEIPHRRVG